MIRNRPIIKDKYVEKTNLFRKDFEKSIKLVSETEDKKSRLIDEINILQREKTDIERKINSSKSELGEIENRIKEKEKEKVSLINFIGKIKQENEENLDELKRQLYVLKERIKNKENITKQLLQKEHKILDLESEIQKRVIIIDELNDKIEEQKIYIQKENDRLQNEIKKNESILILNKQYFIENEKKERRIENYVKRLQRYYDKQDIKLNILKEFNIKIN